MISYLPDADAVNAFHAAALSCGGASEDLPGPCGFHPDYYGASVRDLDGK